MEMYNNMDWSKPADYYSSLERLKDNFNWRYKKSLFKAELLKREIEGYELVFDEQRLNVRSSPSARYLLSYSIGLTGDNINTIREIFVYNIIEGEDISKNTVGMLSENVGDYRFWYNLTIVLRDYLEWLKQYKNPKQKYPDKYFAWYHQILINLGKASRLPNNFKKKEIIEFGKNLYGTGEGFYKALSKLDLTKTTSFVQSMSIKDKANWKKALADISNNDANVVNYLEQFPN